MLKYVAISSRKQMQAFGLCNQLSFRTSLLHNNGEEGLTSVSLAKKLMQAHLDFISACKEGGQTPKSLRVMFVAPHSWPTAQDQFQETSHQAEQGYIYPRKPANWGN